MTSVSFAFQSQPRWRVRPAIWLGVVGGILLFFIYLWMASTLVHLSAMPARVSAAPRTVVTTQKTATPPAQPTPIAPAVATPPASTIPHCSVVSFGLPSSLSLSGAAAGVSLQNDATTYYQIYGNTAAGLRSQIQSCAPGANGSASAEFTGQTSYTLSWEYSVTNNGSSCSLSAAKVGVHTAIALPYWQATGAAASGLASRWQTFMNGLATHEQGHVTLANLYGGKLLSSLQNMGPMDCSSVAGSVQTLANNTTAALKQANDAYDVQTNHGATQGAILPTY